MLRRLRKIAWHSAAAAATVLCVALCVFWARSYRVCDSIHWRSATGFRAVGSASGKVVVQLNPGETQPRGSRGWSYWRGSSYTAPSYPVAYGHLGPMGRTFGRFEFAGLGWYTVRDGAGGRTATGVFPFWLLAAATAPAPLAWATGLARAFVRNRRRRGAGFCRTCSYDLRATPDRCPECGGVAVRPGAAA